MHFWVFHSHMKKVLTFTLEKLLEVVISRKLIFTNLFLSLLKITSENKKAFQITIDAFRTTEYEVST